MRAAARRPGRFSACCLAPTFPRTCAVTLASPLAAATAAVRCSCCRLKRGTQPLKAYASPPPPRSAPPSALWQRARSRPLPRRTARAPLASPRPPSWARLRTLVRTCNRASAGTNRTSSSWQKRSAARGSWWCRLALVQQRRSLRKGAARLPAAIAPAAAPARPSQQQQQQQQQQR